MSKKALLHIPIAVCVSIVIWLALSMIQAVLQDVANAQENLHFGDKLKTAKLSIDLHPLDYEKLCKAIAVAGT